MDWALKPRRRSKGRQHFTADKQGWRYSRRGKADGSRREQERKGAAGVTASEVAGWRGRETAEERGAGSIKRVRTAGNDSWG